MKKTHETSVNNPEGLDEVSQDGKYSKIFLLNKLFNQAADFRIKRIPNFIDAMQTIHDTLEQKHTVEYTDWYDGERKKIQEQLKKTHPNYRRQMKDILEWKLAEGMYPRLNSLTVNVDVVDSTRK